MRPRTPDHHHHLRQPFFSLRPWLFRPVLLLSHLLSLRRLGKNPVTPPLQKHCRRSIKGQDSVHRRRGASSIHALVVQANSFSSIAMELFPRYPL